MGKTLADKKVNRCAKTLNKQIREDVFGDRFSVRQVKKTRNYDVGYYMYELIDKKCPERNSLIPKWFSEFEIINFKGLYLEMNNFIVTSDFWETYKK